MSDKPIPPAPDKPRQTVRGGFCVIGRTAVAQRLEMKSRCLFEHPSLESASAQANRLAAEHGREFVVFQEVASALPQAADQAEAA